MRFQKPTGTRARILPKRGGAGSAASDSSDGGRHGWWIIGFVLVVGVFLTARDLRTAAANDERALELPVFTAQRNVGLDFVHINGGVEHKDYIPEAKGGGVGFLDFDGDGWLDVYIVQGSTIERFRRGDNPHGSLFRNRGDGTFEDVTARAGLTKGAWGMGVSAADYDNDGFVDLYLTNLGPNFLYRNNGDGTFTEVTEAAGVGDPRWSTSAAFGDIDGDGDLDLYVPNYLTLNMDRLPPRNCSHRGNIVLCGPSGLEGAGDVLYRNNGDGTFTDITEDSGATDPDRYYGLSVVMADLDNDGDLDIVVGNDATPNLVFVNRGNGTFEEMGFLTGLAVNADGLEQASMGLDVADYNNDGLLDAFMTHFSLEYSTLYENKGDLLFEDVTARAKLADPSWLLVSWGTRFVDFDLDGWKDIIHANGHVYPYLMTAQLSETYAQPKSLYRNQRDGTFLDVGSLVGPDARIPEVSRGVAFGDYDNDGDIDFVVANMNGSPTLFRCDSPPGRHWVMFRTVGKVSNRDGIGARITVNTQGLQQIWEIKRTVGIYAVSDPRAHFGLGSAAVIEEVVVRWPSGKVQSFRNVAADRHYVIDEELGLAPEVFRR
ncbi:MAG TPA: CRTAC1 family protein [Acidobacteriota bacterium]|nr:CRTAC1 family protein [Acidobacteriota bacterium]